MLRVIFGPLQRVFWTLNLSFFLEITGIGDSLPINLRIPLKNAKTPIGWLFFLHQGPGRFRPSQVGVTPGLGLFDPLGISSSSGVFAPLRRVVPRLGFNEAGGIGRRKLRRGEPTWRRAALWGKLGSLFPRFCCCCFFVWGGELFWALYTFRLGCNKKPATFFLPCPLFCFLRLVPPRILGAGVVPWSVHVS